MNKAPGTYALLLHANRNRTITVGALGELQVSSGTYVYVGSALGPGGLRARVERHVRGDGHRHWHVDYLRAVTELSAVWYTHSEQRRECMWASVLRRHSEASIPLPGFGASDCECPTHLVALDMRPSLAEFRERMKAEGPDAKSIQRAEPSVLLSK
jgi:Uri superfamily endonuclease